MGLGKTIRDTFLKAAVSNPRGLGLFLAKTAIARTEKINYEELRLVAVPRSFTPAQLAILLGARAAAAGEVLAELKRLNLVTRRPGEENYAVPSAMRLPLRHQLQGEDAPRFTEISRRLAQSLVRSDRPLSSAEAVEQIYHLMACSPEVAVDYARQLTRAIARAGDEPAITALGQALAELLDLPQLAPVARAMCSLAKARAGLRQAVTEEGLQLATEAKNLFASIGDNRGIVDCLIVLASSEARRAGHEAGLAYAQQATEVAQRMIEQSPTPDTLLLRAATENLCGGILARMNRQADSIPHYLRDIAFCEQALGQAENDLWILRATAVAHQNLALVLREEGNRAKAREHSAMERTLTEKVLTLAPGNFLARYDMAISIGSEANEALEAQEFHAAAAKFEESNRLLQQLLQDFPHHPDVTSSIVLNHQGRGESLRGLDDPVQAAEAFAASIPLAQALVDVDERHANWLRNLSVSHNKLGECLLAQGKLAEAKAEFVQDLALAEKVLALEPTSQEFQQEVEESRSKVAEVTQRLENNRASGA